MSRRRKPKARSPMAVLIRAEDRACFPAWHVANLAAALAARRLNVHVSEFSGLLPNVAFHMGLSPREYMAEEAGSRFHEALSGVLVSLSPSADRSHAADVNLYHLPLTGADGERRDRHPGVAEGGGYLEIVIRHHRPVPCGSAAVLSPGGASVEFWALTEPGSTGDKSLGHVTGWEGHLCDRFPVVLSRPNGELSRSYFDVCDGILVRNAADRRKTEVHDGEETIARPFVRPHR